MLGPRKRLQESPHLAWVLTFLTPFLMFWVFLVGDLLAELWFLREVGRGGWPAP